MVGRQSKTGRLRKDVDAIKDDARGVVEETLSHPVVDRVVEVIRERPVTAVLVAAAAVFVGTRLMRHRQWEE